MDLDVRALSNPNSRYRIDDKCESTVELCFLMFNNDKKTCCMVMGIASTGARMATVLSPFLIGLQELVSWLPGVAFGSFAFFTGFMCFLLPETHNQPMPMTIQDAIDLHKQSKSRAKFNEML